jgi:hypothetical protein
MSFWGSTKISYAAPGERFVPAPSPFSATSPPTSYTFSFANEKAVPAVQQFLLQHFARQTLAAPTASTASTASTTPPAHPLLVAPLRPSPDERLLQATDASGTLAGCIRFKRSGLFEGQQLSLVDAFCVRPDHRKTGLATTLLSVLRSETQTDSPYSLFLKEGTPLPIPQAPLYSSLYVYCRQQPFPPASFSSPPPFRIRTPPPAVVQAYLRAYQILRPDTFVCWDPCGENQMWRLWREGHQWMLVCVQDAYQEIPTPSNQQRERIGWLTALFESPGFAAAPHRNAVLRTLLQTTPFPWIWTDRVFVNTDDTTWQFDGPFHWYAHGWTTCLRPGANYAIVV